MTQKSLPWGGVAPASGADAGRYSVEEWWGAWASEQLGGGVVISSPLLRTDATLTNVGVYYSVPNRLAVTSPNNNRIDVNTGAWICDGQYGYNDTSIGGAGNISSPAGDPRIDRVVVRKNFTNNTYDPASAAAAYDVPPLTARVTIIHGVENVAPVAPSLVQDTARNPAGAFGTDGTWDIPLAQYEISVGGVITNLVDEREWVDAQDKSFVVAPYTSENQTDVTEPLLFSAAGLVMPTAKQCRALGAFIVPADFISGMTVESIFVTLGAAGNVRALSEVDFGLDGESWDNTTINSTVTFASTAQTNIIAIPLTLAGVTIDDIVRPWSQRLGLDGLDTYGNDVILAGWLVKYLGWKR